MGARCSECFATVVTHGHATASTLIPSTIFLSAATTTLGELSRMLTQIKLPVQGGELTDMAVARDEMTFQDTQSPFGVARDVPEKLHADTGDRSGGSR